MWLLHFSFLRVLPLFLLMLRCLLLAICIVTYINGPTLVFSHPLITIYSLTLLASRPSAALVVHDW
ncbi:hypothetical protein BDF19DRAFT_446528 [Syncephalis fuscata]|nr:hypothetical protein BDF19DRAFT_446528 [Syncephalis fuscata]